LLTSDYKVDMSTLHLETKLIVTSDYKVDMSTLVTFGQYCKPKFCGIIDNTVIDL
jgi:hypothetical protein